MIVIKEVETKKQQKEFLNFPLKLYKDNPYFAPPLYSDEKKIFRADYMYYDTCEAIYFIAYDGEKPVGRISGILQKASNQKTGEKRVRFGRFDCINDIEVAKALFDAVENWAKSKGMDTVCGPLGFSDLEREGLLIEGFEELSTFEEQYNFEYYQHLIEKCGYGKEVDWVESKLYAPSNPDDRLNKMSNLMLQKYGLHFAKAKNKRDFIKTYGEAIFELLDITYADIYGTVPFTPGTKKMIVDNFMLIINLKHVAAILDKDNRLVCFGLCFPSIAKALQKSSGKLTPLALLRLLKAIKHPEVLDLALVGVLPEYAMKGISTAAIAIVYDALVSGKVKYAETNLNLEDNHNIRNLWKNFNAVQHKRRRAYIKKLENCDAASTGKTEL